MSLPGPIVSLSDEILTTLVQMCRPLTPPARIAFLEALAVLLRQEPQQPPGDGTVCRHARELLRSGLYHRDGAFILDDHVRNQEPNHYRPRPAKAGCHDYDRRR